MTDVLLSCQIPKLKQLENRISVWGSNLLHLDTTYSDALRVIEKPHFYADLDVLTF